MFGIPVLQCHFSRTESGTEDLGFIASENSLSEEVAFATVVQERLHRFGKLWPAGPQALQNQLCFCQASTLKKNLEPSPTFSLMAVSLRAWTEQEDTLANLLPFLQQQTENCLAPGVPGAPKKPI